MMKKILYILMSGILGTVLISCDSNFNDDYKIENLSTVKAKVSYNSSKGSFKICMDSSMYNNLSDIRSIGDFFKDETVGDKTYGSSSSSSSSNFCKVLYKSDGVDQFILIPKSFSIVTYRNCKKYSTRDSEDEITYNVYSGTLYVNESSYTYSSTKFKTFKVSPNTILGTLTLD